MTDAKTSLGLQDVLQSDATQLRRWPHFNKKGKGRGAPLLFYYKCFCLEAVVLPQDHNFNHIYLYQLQNNLFYQDDTVHYATKGEAEDLADIGEAQLPRTTKPKPPQLPTKKQGYNMSLHTNPSELGTSSAKYKKADQATTNDYPKTERVW